MSKLHFPVLLKVESTGHPLLTCQISENLLQTPLVRDILLDSSFKTCDPKIMLLPGIAKSMLLTTAAKLQFVNYLE